MSFRFIHQSCMAAGAAFRDARRPGTAPGRAGVGMGPLAQATLATARIVLLGFAMDGIYQATVLGTFYPGEMLVVAILLAYLPYLVLRPTIGRLVRGRKHRGYPFPNGGDG